MGCWGMGMMQSDEFCEIYDRFMNRYNNEETDTPIEKEIPLSEFTDIGEVFSQFGSFRRVKNEVGQQT